ncbi:MAG: hypothetical protein HLUCCA11_16975 [Phormidesmis priestleyi Ana]|uniref:Uncharacterized protein n=1 Tax=Phormidesmis priestleyi Ana TaxID=1666911 RepID=A0A0P8BY45_9CYAN|nr:MAG: hypothetical protein HLUCCA11_16975 [Phormidesmis priestleyi Ana]
MNPQARGLHKVDKRNHALNTIRIPPQRRDLDD